MGQSKSKEVKIDYIKMLWGEIMDREVIFPFVYKTRNIFETYIAVYENVVLKKDICFTGLTVPCDIPYLYLIIDLHNSTYIFIDDNLNVLWKLFISDKTNMHVLTTRISSSNLSFLKDNPRTLIVYKDDIFNKHIATYSKECSKYLSLPLPLINTIVNYLYQY